MDKVAHAQDGPPHNGAGLFVAEPSTKGAVMKRHYLLASDFDQTLSFNDSGIVLSDMLGITGFREKVAGLSNLNLVQKGAELASLLAHDPDLRRVTPQYLQELGLSA